MPRPQSTGRRSSARPSSRSSSTAGADSETGSPTGWTLSNPGIISIPLGFLGCILGTLLSSERGTDRSFHELYVRSETGLGSEKALTHQ